MNMKVKIAIAAVIVVALVALILVDQKTSAKKPAGTNPAANPAPGKEGALFAKKDPRITKDTTDEGEILISRKGDVKENPPSKREMPPSVDNEKTIKGGDATEKSDTTIKPDVHVDPAFEEYVIKAGDTYSSIAGKTYGDDNLWKVIADANPDVKPSSMKVGKKIRIPVKPTVRTETIVETGTSGRTYVVQPGDTLGEISRKVYSTTRYADRIFEANRDKLASPDELHVGLKLTLPEIAPKKETEKVAPETEALVSGRKVHKVAPKEALWNIADQYRGDRGVLEMIDQIIRANPDKLRDANTTLRVGWALVIPD